jgi:hypothetical protein
MHLKRIGEPGAERPVVRVEQTQYLDGSNVSTTSTNPSPPKTTSTAFKTPLDSALMSEHPLPRGTLRSADLPAPPHLMHRPQIP